MRVTIELPDDVAADLRGESGADPSRAAIELMACEGYRSGSLTHAQVGRLLGFTHPLQVEAFLKEHDVPLPYTLEDWERDRETLRKLSI